MADDSVMTPMTRRQQGLVEPGAGGGAAAGPWPNANRSTRRAFPPSPLPSPHLLGYRPPSPVTDSLLGEVVGDMEGAVATCRRHWRGTEECV